MLTLSGTMTTRYDHGGRQSSTHFGARSDSRPNTHCGRNDAGNGQTGGS